MYITDLDNTLLNQQGLLSEYSKNMLKEIIPHIDITFATARSLFTAGVVLDYVDFKLPAIILNGAAIINPETRTFLKTYPIPYSVIKEIIQVSEDITFPFIVGVHNNKEILLHKTPQLDIHNEYLDSRLRFNDSRQTLVEEYFEVDDFLCLSFIEHKENILELKRKFEKIDGINVYYHPNTKKGTDYCTIDIMSKHASKGNAVREVCKLIGKDIKVTVSFGDDVNDLSMFEVTERAFVSEVSRLDIDLPRLTGEDSVIQWIIRDSVKIEEVFEMKNIDELVDESKNEFGFVRRLRDEYNSGNNAFNKTGECLFIASVGSRVVGTCGLNIDPYINKEGFGRVRHMYVLKPFRRLHIASRLLENVIDKAQINFTAVTLRTFSEEASKMYISNGFIETNKIEYVTHIKE